MTATQRGAMLRTSPSEFTSASTLELVRLFEEAGLPPGVVNVVTGFGPKVGSPLVEHPLVRKISFTGSDTTGRLINEQAARHLKHVSLELGGKSPNSVFADADLDAEVNGVVSGIFSATGQTCIAGSRLLVHESVHDEVVRRGWSSSPARPAWAIRGRRRPRSVRSRRDPSSPRCSTTSTSPDARAPRPCLAASGPRVRRVWRRRVRGADDLHRRE